MLSLVRPIRFEEVDAAKIVFFPRILGYCHEAMEALFGELEGGYSRLILERHIGLPAVHVEIDFRAPLRYGDSVTVEVAVASIGNTSCTFDYRLERNDGVLAATVRHVCVVVSLEGLEKIAIPDDIRAVLSRHLSSSPA